MESACPICGSTSEYAFDSKFVRVAKCDNQDCGHLFAAGVAADHGVQTGWAEDLSLFDRRNRGLVDYWVAEGFIGSGSLVLDAGAGAGHIASAVRERLEIGSITCVEPDDDTRTLLVDKGHNAVATLDMVRGTFDAVILVEVVEHVPEPVDLLRRCCELLASSGQIFLTTPCGETRRGSRATNAYDTPEHAHFFTESSLRLACSNAGLVMGDYDTVNALYPRDDGISGWSISVGRNVARHLRNRVLGTPHLVGFARPMS